MLSLAGRLSNHELLAQVKLLAQREREATAVLIAHLAVLDERTLYLAEGCSSMFTYCVQVLHLSEHAAYGRIEAGRAARRYPVILELLSDGSVNLTTVRLLAPHLTRENHGELLEAAKHKSKRQVEELVAELRPQPSVPSTIRRLPAPKPFRHRPWYPRPPAPAPPGAFRQPIMLWTESRSICCSCRPHCHRPARQSLPRLRHSATKCSSRPAQRRVRSCGLRRTCCGTRSQMGIWDRSSIGP